MGSVLSARPLPVDIDETGNPADLTAIYDPNVVVAVWRRRPNPTLRRFTGDVLARLDFEQSLDIPASNPRIATTHPGLAESPGADALLADMSELVTLYADLTGATRIGWRLASLARSMCPRFHVDRVGIRLVCTYRGQGTEWLPGASADRTRLGRGAAGRTDQESGLILDHADIGRASTFDVVLLKGESWPANSGNGAIHRSPNVDQNDRRLVMTLDSLA